MTDFRKTVNLRQKAEAEKKEAKKKPTKAQAKKSQEIDRLYEEENSSAKSEFAKMNRPKTKENNQGPYRGLVFVLLVALAIVSFFAFAKNDNGPEQSAGGFEEKWYSVELQNGDVFYGLIGDLSANPLQIQNVYYNYDQAKEGEENPSGNLRLVKRGKETHGPKGSINIYQSNINILEELNEDSKVLQAILENEG